MDDTHLASGCFAGFLSIFKKPKPAVLASSSAVCEVKSHSHPAAPSDNFLPPATTHEPYTEAHDLYGNCCCSSMPDAALSSFSESLPAYYSPEDEKKNGFLNDAPACTPMIDTIKKEVEERSAELREISMALHANPELGFNEVFAHKTITEYLVKQGFDVTPSYLLPTAFLACFENKPSNAQATLTRTVGFNSEYDALPGIGHACGHNLIAIGGIGALLGLRKAMINHKIAGKICLIGTPAEEGGGGKVKLIEKGAYKGLDACLMLHPSPGPRNQQAIASSLAIQVLRVEYRGKTAHAAGAPWDGINTLDACNIAYASISALRQQLPTTFRVHGIIEPNPNFAPNIIPDFAAMRFYIRAPTTSQVEHLKIKIQNCFTAAGLATGCKVQLFEEPMHKDLRHSSVLAQEFKEIMEYAYQAPTLIALGDVNDAAGGSTDFGNVTYETVALHPSFAIDTIPGGGNHTPFFTAAARSMQAHDQLIKTTVGIASVGCKVLCDAAFAKAATEAWKADMAKP